MKQNRYAYIDNLRTLMIILVILIHAACTYSPVGGWYFKESLFLDELSLISFVYFQSFTQAFFMGLLFLLAGYFIPRAYDKKAFKAFMIGRLKRLGIPTLIYIFLIDPLIVYYLLGKAYLLPTMSFTAYYSDYISSLRFIGSTGPLWFTFALLIMSFIYALARKISSHALNTPNNNNLNTPIKTRYIIVGVIAIALLNFLVRIFQPIGSSLLNLQLCYFSQYVIFFIIGIKAYRYSWLDRIDFPFAKRYFYIAIIPGFFIWLLILVVGGALTSGFDPFLGGLTLHSLAFSTWESMIGVFMSIGLIGIFKEKFNQPKPFTYKLSRNSFAVYVWHTPILIIITLVFIPLEMIPLLKFITVGAITVPLCFISSELIFRRLPFMS